jgi:hypothetical protein
MSFWFGDSFDLYAAAADASPSYWDTGSGTGWSLVAGRFSGSRGLQSIAGVQTNVLKNSGVNEAVHHISLAVQQTTALTGTAVYVTLQLGDGATVQCTLAFRSDGAILVYSGTTAGTLLGTYTGAIAAINTWYQFEIEVVINNTTGSVAVRKNGNTSNDFSLTSVNTRGGTANNYANRLLIGNGNGGAGPDVIDDLLWRSDPSSLAWLGDIRCYTRMPTSDQAIAWTPSNATLVPQTPAAATTTTATSATTAKFAPFIAAANGAIGTLSVSLGTGYTGNMKCTIFANSGSNTPGAVLGSATPIVNPAAGNNTFTFSTPVAVTQGTPYWVGFMADAAGGTWSVAAGTTGLQQIGTTYAAFPTASPTTGVGSLPIFTANLTPTAGINYALTAEAQQDAANTYVSSATVAQSDLYGIAPIAATPATTIAVVTRGYMQKSDAGTRNAAIQLKSGASLVNSGSAALGAGTWGWLYRVDQVDPATSAAWTATAVNNAQIGPVVTA